MFKKVLFVTIFVVFAYVQLAVALDCSICNTERTCAQTPLPEVTCTTKNAHETSQALREFYQRVPNTTSENFVCLTIHLKQGAKLDTLFELKGCAFNETNACSLQVKDTVEAPYTAACSQEFFYTENNNTTTGNGNGNPAGSFSSSVLTMFASAVGVALAKRFVF